MVLVFSLAMGAALGGSLLATATFPVFSFVLSATVLYTLVRPTKSWKPIPHGKTANA